MRHHFHEIAHHFFPDPPDQRRSFFRDANHDLAPIFPRAGTHDVAEIFQPIDQTARRRGRVSHFLRDGRHRQDFLEIQRGEKKKLREGNIPRRQLFGETQDEATLHFQDDVREAFGVSTNLIGAVEPQLGRGVQTA